MKSAVDWFEIPATDIERAARFYGQIYDTETERGIRRAVLTALFTRGDVDELIRIARDETDRELRAHAVRLLSVMNSPESTEFMKELLSE